PALALPPCETWALPPGHSHEVKPLSLTLDHMEASKTKTSGYSSPHVQSSLHEKKDHWSFRMTPKLSYHVIILYNPKTPPCILSLRIMELRP
ncbi:hypothetical protein VIGAN_10218100, partial [Vigna angularis var. angularis]